MPNTKSTQVVIPEVAKLLSEGVPQMGFMCLLHLFLSCGAKERQCSRAVLVNEKSESTLEMLAEMQGQREERDC